MLVPLVSASNFGITKFVISLQFCLASCGKLRPSITQGSAPQENFLLLWLALLYYLGFELSLLFSFVLTVCHLWNFICIHVWCYSGHCSLEGFFCLCGLIWILGHGQNWKHHVLYISENLTLHSFWMNVRSLCFGRWLQKHVPQNREPLALQDGKICALSNFFMFLDVRRHVPKVVELMLGRHLIFCHFANDTKLPVTDIWVTNIVGPSTL